MSTMEQQTMNRQALTADEISTGLSAAYRSWAAALSACNGKTYQVHEAASERKYVGLLEVLCRATMEVYIGLSCDGCDSRADVGVCMLIHEQLGLTTLNSVRVDCLELGCPLLGPAVRTQAGYEAWVGGLAAENCSR